MVAVIPNWNKVKNLPKLFEYQSSSPHTRQSVPLQYYRGSLPYAHFGTWKKLCYMKFVLVGLYCSPLLMLIPPFQCVAASAKFQLHGRVRHGCLRALNSIRQSFNGTLRDSQICLKPSSFRSIKCKYMIFSPVANLIYHPLLASGGIFALVGDLLQSH